MVNRKVYKILLVLLISFAVTLIFIYPVIMNIDTHIAGKKISKRYDLTKPQGVRSRNSDNTLLKRVLNWQPEVTLEDGLKKTYEWIVAMTRNAKKF